MAKYQKYAEYKDSGVEWLGEIPSHWQASYVGVVSDVIDPQPDHRAPAISEDGEGFPYIGIRDVNKDGTLNFETARPVEESAVLKQERSFTIEPHNIIFCKVGTLGLPRKIIPHGRCALSATLVLIKARKINSQFLLYALDSDCIISQTNFLATGSTRAALGIQQIRKFRIPFPPLLDQLAITNFLDHETAKIDTLIGKQEKLIELLKEKRQAVISHAVTKGLNSDVTMKDSGVEWLGQVPEHWDMAPVRRYLVEHRQGYYTTESYVDDGLKLLRITDLRDLGEINIFNCPMVNESDTTHLFKLQKGDVVFARTGGAGSFGVITEDYENLIYASYLIRFRFMNKIFEPDYLRFLFQSDSFQLSVKQNIHGGVNQNIHAEDIKNTVVCAPSLLEQKEIIEYLENQCSLFENLINKAIYSVQLMQERRTALISSAVTGKIDVRHHASRPTGNDKKQTEGI